MSPADAQTTAPNASEVDWEELRRRFGIFEHKTYINSCSYGALADSVKMAMQGYLDDRLVNGANWDEWVLRNEALRAATARLLGCDGDEVAITTSASAGISSLASALDFTGPRNQVVISDLEFPTNAQIWYAQQKRGAQVIRVPEIPGQGVALEQLDAVIGPNTRIVALTHVCYRNSARQDIAAIARLAHERGALMMVDGYQSVGSMSCDVRQLDVDFLAGGNAKYLLGTSGVGYFYARQNLIESLVPTITGWFADSDIFAMSVARYSPSKSARRFETGTPPVPNVYGALAGLELIESVGMVAIEARNRELANTIVQRASDAGYRLATPANEDARGMMVAIASTDEQQLVEQLHRQYGIVTSSRDGNLRVAPHFYNNDADINTLFAALHSLPDLLCRA